MTLAYQRFTAVLLLISGSFCLSGVYYCLNVFWCAVARMSELLIFGKSGSEIRKMLVQVYGDSAMKKITVYKWVSRFSEGRESVTDEAIRPASNEQK
jgi:hypothetical protein